MKRGFLGLAAATALAGIVLLTMGTPPATGAAAAKRRPAAKAKAVDDSNTVLVRIGRETITRGDVQRRIESLPEQFRAQYSTPEGRQQLLDRLVEEQVWFSLAVKNGVADRPAIRDELERQRRGLVVRTYVGEVMGANPAPADSQALRYYNEHRSDYRVPGTVTLRHIQTKTEGDAKRVKAMALRKGQDWTKLVQRFSTDTLTRASGGSLGSVTRDGVFPSLGSQPALAEAAFTLGEGAIGGPYRTDRGWHVIKVDAVKPESERSFDQVKPVILQQLTRQNSQDFYKAQLDKARRTLNIKSDSSAIKNFITQRKTPREQFNDAQGLTAPTARIEAYRKLLQDYPESDVSPQALFMVGFIYSEEMKNYDDAEKAFRELLRRYPKAELAASAQWMLDHMRTEEAPPFISLDEDSAGHSADSSQGAKGGGKKP